MTHDINQTHINNYNILIIQRDKDSVVPWYKAVIKGVIIEFAVVLLFALLMLMLQRM